MDRGDFVEDRTEWLAASFYGRSRLMPRDVRERLGLLGLIDADLSSRLQADGWLEERFLRLHPRPGSGKQ